MFAETFRRKQAGPVLAPFLKRLLFIFFFFPANTLFSQENVGIGTITPDESAVLELSTQLLSSPKGFLVPRITSLERNAIASPANGLLIYNIFSNQFEYNVGTAGLPSWLSLLSSASGGTVTSVGLSLPSVFSVTDSLVTSEGTLTATLASQAQNRVFAGPPSGANAIPTFRVLDPLDIPNLDAAKVTTGVLPIARGGTNSASLPVAGGVAYGSGTAYAFSAAGTSGHVLSSNGTGAPSFRGLTASDISAGTLTVPQGGTGAATITGILAGNGTTAVAGRTITGTANQIGVSNGNGATANPVLTIADNPVLPGTGSVTLPSGTTGNRPGTPTNGMMRFNTTAGKTEIYQNGTWSSSVVGSGTANYVPKFTESTTIGNSILYSNETTVALGTTSPSTIAALEINSTTQGFLPSRMTLAQRDAITSPPQGLIVYVTDSPGRGLYIYDTSPASGWVLLQTIDTDAVGGTKTVVKSGASQNGTNTLADDSELFISVGANQVWNIEGFIGATNSDGGPDLRTAFAIPTGSSMGISVNYTTGTSSNAFNLISSGAYVTSIAVANNAPTLVRYYGTISTGNTGGTIKFQFSQNTAKLSAPVTVLANSFLKATRIK